ncbi:MAG: hypothetical protein AB7M12_14365 [Hyphomonadaceae bacterium]
MTSAASAIEAAAYAALTAGVTLSPVHQHVPQDTPPPVTIVGDIDLEPFQTKDQDGDRQGTLVITCVVEGEARKPLLDLQDEVEAALSGLRVEAGGWLLLFTFQSSDGLLVADPVSEESEGGETYVGTSRFNVLALSN